MDDLGWADIGYRNKMYHTPNVDALCKEGLEFTKAYIPTPTCSPSRSSLLTGKESVRMGFVRHIPNNDHKGEFHYWPKDPAQMPSRNYLPLSEITYAERLHDYGYYNFFLGKWHLGHEEKYYPENQGFDEVFGSTEAFKHSFKPYYHDKKIKEGAYKTDVLTNEAVRQIIAYDKDKPFSMSLWYYNVHAPLQGRKDWVEFYNNKGITGDLAEYGAMVSTMDESIGKVRKAIKDKGIANNTIIVFLSDQGGRFKNAHLRGGKMGGDALAEGGARVPFIIHYPGVTKPGSKCETRVQSIDLYPTIMEIASGEACNEPQIQGKTLLPALNGEILPSRKLYSYRSYEDQNSAIIDGDWKLIKYRSGKCQLYNLKDNEEEQNDLFSIEPEKAEKLKASLLKWEKEAVPTF
ncbi:sulfatase [Flavivirga amylovorans]